VIAYDSVTGLTALERVVVDRSPTPPERRTNDARSPGESACG
jgi:hypothetical protein